MVGLRIMIVVIKLDNCIFYIKIRIWPFLDRIILSIFKMIRPRITNKLNGQFLSLFFFFGKLTYVLKEEDTNIIRGIPQIYNDNRNIKQQMATG